MYLIVTMTNWFPDIQRAGTPIYIEIADAMAHDIDNGKLKPGEKLPPQRNLAFDIGVTIGDNRASVHAGPPAWTGNRRSRAAAPMSAPANHRCLKQVPRRPVITRLPMMQCRTASTQAPGKLRLDSTSAPEVGQSAIITRHVAAIMADYPNKTTDYIRSLKPEWQQAGQSWLSTGGWQADVASIVRPLAFTGRYDGSYRHAHGTR